ncbi:hypothetical protein OG389_34275 [Streptomyces sp. NBC_00435]|uniref:hypothetical protein n=1 Tax=Streptomyces sp. NBC_00435 TaxID=2903649 RepID=UPI002E1A9108
MTENTTTEGGDPACHLHLLCPVCGAVARERRESCCARYAGPVRHRWLGVLRPDGEGRLTGGIAIGPAVRPAAANGDTDCGVRIGAGLGTGLGLGPVDLDDAAARIRRALEGLEVLKDFALELAPADWRRHSGTADGTPLRERLFLHGFDVIGPDAMDVAFDCGERGTLIVRVDGSGRGRDVRLEL